jgi:hypothetical protein
LDSACQCGHFEPIFNKIGAFLGAPEAQKHKKNEKRRKKSSVISGKKYSKKND